MEQEEIKISANVSDNNVNYKMDLPLKDLISDEFIEDHDVTSQNVISTTDCASSEASPSETDANKEQSKLNQEILQESTNNITPENRSAETNAADTSAAETSSANTEAEPVQAESTVPEKPTSEATSESEGAHIVQENVDELDDASEQEIKTVQDEGERVEITELVTEESTDDANVPTVDKVNSVTEEKNVETSEILIDIDAAAPNDVTENDAVSEKAGVDIADEKEQENDNPTVFVQVNDENEKEGSDENDKYDNEAHKDMLEDPIASADIFDQLNEDREGADEELCIIPDTERVISQAEKDAASSIPPLRDIVEVSASLDIISDKEKSIEDSSSPFIIHKYEKDDLQKCGLRQCSAMRNVKYFYKKPDEQLEYICDDDCLQTFKSSNEQKVVLSWEEGNLRVKNFSSRDTVKELPSVIEFVRKCRACNEPLKHASSDNGEINTHLTWEIMDFCDELCLTKYQKEIGSFCSSCNASVKNNSLGKYCVRFGNDIRQFCTSHCLEEYKKGLKVCSYCQHDISGGTEGFLAPVGDKGQFKDFCSQLCMEKYDIMTNNRTPKVAVGTKCSVCNGEKPISIEFELDNKANYFCSEPCFVAFSFVNNITTGKCAMCRRSFTKKILQDHTMFYENTQHSFCSNSCQNIYIIAYRKIVPCSWCKVKKYNFDMIQKYSDDGLQLNMCSINCLNLYQLSLVSILKEQPCNFCNKVLKTLYQLNMSDTTKRSFCSYNCVWSFQNKFSNSKILASKGEDIIPVGPPRKAKKILNRLEENGSNIPALPVITNVQSLANTNGNMHPLPALTTISTRATRVKSVPPTVELPIKYKQHYILQPSPLPEQRNASIQCSVRTNTKSCSCEPVMVDKECQTTEVEIRKILIPIPVPIYVPTPLHMFAAPVPIPVPFPLPIPIPIFIPTTRNSAMGILKEIKKIQVKIPTDPYEAELLMMAEMVAGEKKEDHTDSESDVEDSQPADDSTFSPEPVDTNSTFGDDMLQMALKMATELDEPAVDLEGALTANTITAPHGAGVTNLEVSEDQPNAPSLRGRKRTRQIKGNSSTKRGRRLSHQVDIPLMTSPVAPVPTTEPAEKPDANMCLKYTFGVNAWKQWVTTKYTELEKSSKRIKMFKTEILQLTADELNYSLCLFVKEVRKPSGAEYAPDTIYYLCLGIQQYLFENGRIDNIFCDSYYEKFTDCLDEVAKKFSVLYNESHYIVTRVEEEHLWESKQLGAHSPHVLLSTLMFFNTKHFNLTSVDEHMQLSFSHIMKHWKRNPNQPGASKVPGSRNVLLRFYPPQSAIQNNARKKKVYEQQENEENPLRCPVKLYEFYLSKCPESVKTRNDVFYLQPERSCVPDSPVWYSTMPLPRDALEKMLHRVKMVKEINVALLTS